MGEPTRKILDWWLERGSHSNEEHILIFVSFLRKRGWRDDEATTKAMQEFKASSGLAHRSDIVTFFDFYEVNEKRRP